MAISLASLHKTGAARPPLMLIYGTHGVGKTSLAAQAPSPVFIQTEDGAGMNEFASFGVLRSFGEVLEATGALYSEPHEYRTLVIDSLDHLEPLVWQAACAAQTPPWPSIEAPGYGKGYLAANDQWRLLLDGLAALRDHKGMTVILIAHCDSKLYSPPEVEPYNRYGIKLNKGASELVQERADCVLFTNWRTSIMRDKGAFASKDGGKARGVGAGQREVWCEARPPHVAKNRYGMPAQSALPDGPQAAWSALATHVPFLNENT